MTGMTGPLISAAELHDLLGSLTVLDVRYRMGGPPGPEVYAAGHVPGAAYVDLDADLASAPGIGGRHPLPDPEVFRAAMRRAGVSASRPVVVYDDWAGHAAARAWWLLRHYGHSSVRVLDGGWSAWVASGGEASTSPIAPQPGDFAGEPGSMPVRLAADVLDVGVLVDARAAERYRGETEPIDPVAGHVPGAVNVPTSTNLGPDGRFRPVDRAEGGVRRGRGGGGGRRGGVLRQRRHRLPRRAGDGARRRTGRALPGLVERVGRRRLAPGRDRLTTPMAGVRGEVFGPTGGFSA